MSTENKGKTPIQWAEYLPEPIRTQFLESLNQFDVKELPSRETLADAIADWFTWEYTPQRHKYWLDVYTRALNGEFNTPPIPSLRVTFRVTVDVTRDLYVSEEKRKELLTDPINEIDHTKQYDEIRELLVGEIKVGEMEIHKEIKDIKFHK